MKKVKKSTVNTRFFHSFTWTSLNLVHYTIFGYILQYVSDSVMRTKYGMNMMNCAHIVGWSSSLLPAMIMVSGYRARPMASPAAMLDVGGLMVMVRNGGPATSN